MDNKNISFIVAVIITALIVGSGIYFWQYSNIVKSENKNLQQRTQLQQQIDNLNNQVNQLSQQKEEMQQQIDNLNAQLNPIPVPAPERYIKVVSPNGKETLCLDNDFVIKWESKDINSVTLSVVTSEAGSTGNYIIATVSATSSETGKPGEGMYIWKVGHTRGVTLSKGVNYKIQVVNSEGPSVSDTSDSAFEILLCKG